MNRRALSFALCLSLGAAACGAVTDQPVAEEVAVKEASTMGTYEWALAQLDLGNKVRIVGWPAGTYVQEVLPATSPKTYQIYDPRPRWGRPNIRNYVMINDGSTWEMFVP